MVRVKYTKKGQNIPDDVTQLIVDVVSIPSKAFRGKESLKSVVLTDRVQVVGEHAFEGCTSLKKVQFPASGNFAIIGEDAFHSCRNIKDIQLPYGLRVIGSSAFSECSSLQKLFLPETVQAVEPFAFRDCKDLSLAIFPPGVTKLDQSTFFGCVSLKAAIISEGTTAIEDFAFASNKSLQVVEIPQSAVQVHKQSFYDCDALAEKAKDGNVQLLAKQRFHGCPMHWLLYNRHYTKSTNHFLRHLQKVYHENPNTLQRKDMFGLTAIDILGLTSSPYSKIDDHRLFQWLINPKDESTASESTEKEEFSIVDTDDISSHVSPDTNEDESGTSFGDYGMFHPKDDEDKFHMFRPEDDSSTELKNMDSTQNIENNAFPNMDDKFDMFRLNDDSSTELKNMGSANNDENTALPNADQNKFHRKLNDNKGSVPSVPKKGERNPMNELLLARAAYLEAQQHPAYSYIHTDYVPVDPNAPSKYAGLADVKDRWTPRRGARTKQHPQFLINKIPPEETNHYADQNARKMNDDSSSRRQLPSHQRHWHLHHVHAFRPILLSNLSDSYTQGDIKRIFETPLVPLGTGITDFKPIPVEYVDLQHLHCIVGLKNAVDQEAKYNAEQFVRAIKGMEVHNVSKKLRIKFLSGG